MNVGFQTGAVLKKGDIGDTLLRDTFQHLADEALNNGSNSSREVFHYNSKDIYMKNNVPFAKAANIVSLDINGTKKKKNSHTHYNLFVKDVEDIKLSDLDIIFIRGDDLEDEHSIKGVDKIMLKLKETTTIINPWEATLATKDKYDLVERCKGLAIPKTILAYSAKDVHDFLKHINEEKNHNYLVIKGRYGSGGKQVHRVKKDNPNLDTLVDACFLRYGNSLVVQEYIPLTEKGDVRVMMFDGRVLCAVKRIPPHGKWKANILLGGSYVPYQLSQQEREFSEEVGKCYKDVRFMGIDLLSGKNSKQTKDIYLIEVNCNSGMTHEVKKLYNLDIAKTIFDKVRNEIQQRKYNPSE